MAENSLFVDHTGLHALVRRSTPLSGAPAVLRVREFLQLIEHVLFADVIYFADTESAAIMDLASQINEQLLDAGLATSHGGGAARLAHISQRQYVEICRRAARAAYFELRQHEPKWLSSRFENRGYSLRPMRVLPVDLAHVTNVQFGSDAAEAHISGAMARKGISASSSLPLLDEDLYVWFKEHLNENEPADSPLNLRLSVLLRWKTNEEIAAHVGIGTSSVPYAPALGRGLLIESFEAAAWSKHLTLIEAVLNGKFRTRTLNQRLFELQKLGPVPTLRVPAFAIRFLLKLPETCSFERFLKELALAREAEDVIFLRRRLRELPASELEELSRRVAAEIRMPESQKRLPNVFSSAYIKFTALKLPMIEIGGEVRVSPDNTDRNLWKEPLTIGRLWRRFWKGREITILTGYMDDILAESGVQDAIAIRFRSILTGAPHA